PAARVRWRSGASSANTSSSRRCSSGGCGSSLIDRPGHAPRSLPTRLPMSTTALALVPLLLLVSAANAAAQDGWRAHPEVVRRTAAGRSEFNYDESKVPTHTLPDPLVGADGQRVASPAQWAARRAELLELFRDN